MSFKKKPNYSTKKRYVKKKAKICNNEIIQKISKSELKIKSKSKTKKKRSSSKFTRRVKFKSNEILKFDKREPVDSLLINRKKLKK